jgi:ABC-type nickel/cobalt efflux system permease component RcnA
MITILAGLAAGAAHVIAGPDHLAALAPIAIDRPQRAVALGLRWGLGHGLGVIVLGGLGILAQSSLDLHLISAWSELLVGFMLILIGLWALRRASKIVIHAHPHKHSVAHDDAVTDDAVTDDAVTDDAVTDDAVSPSDHHIHLHVHPHGLTDHSLKQHQGHSHAVFFVGLLHGSAGTGHLLGVIPSLALSTTDAIAYLCAYFIAAVCSMGAFGGLLGLISRHSGPRVIQQLMYAVSSIVLVVGVFWVTQSWYI